MSDVNSPSAPKRAAATERKRQALELRMDGTTFEQIGKELGVSKQAAHALVVKALDEARQKSAISAEQLREMELTRLDSLWRTAYTLAKSQNQNNLAAIDRCLRIMERRAKLTGLDRNDVQLTYDLSQATDEQLQRIANGEHPLIVLAAAGPSPADAA